MKYILALGIALVLNAAANLLMKMGMRPVQQAGGLMKDGILAAVKTILTSAELMIGLTFFGLNAACYMYALQSESLKISIAYPIMVGGGFALIALVAHWHPALLESLNGWQWCGVVLVLMGVIVIAFNTQSSPAVSA